MAYSVYDLLCVRWGVVGSAKYECQIMARMNEGGFARVCCMEVSEDLGKDN